MFKKNELYNCLDCKPATKLEILRYRMTVK